MKTKILLLFSLLLSPCLSYGISVKVSLFTSTSKGMYKEVPRDTLHFSVISSVPAGQMEYKFIKGEVTDKHKEALTYFFKQRFGVNLTPVKKDSGKKELFTNILLSHIIEKGFIQAGYALTYREGDNLNTALFYFYKADK